MYLFRRHALLLAIILSATYVVQAEEPSSSSSSASVDPAQAHTPIQPNSPTDSQTQPAAPQQPATQPQTQAPAPADSQSPAEQSQAAAQTQGQLSVQARIRARRAQRRAQAIHEIYDHLYDGYVGAGYLRFQPGPTAEGIERVNMYNWNAGFTRYFSERLGVTVDGRGYYGQPFIEPTQDAGSGINKPAISVYSVMGGPTYRFYIQPKFSVSGRVMAGYAQGNFTGDTNGEGSLCDPTTGKCALWHDGPTFAANASVFVEFNVAPNLGIRIAPDYMLTGFGSTLQNGLGYTAGIVVRFGKQ